MKREVVIYVTESGVDRNTRAPKSVPVDIVDKDQDSPFGVGVSTALVPRMKMLKFFLHML